MMQRLNFEHCNLTHSLNEMLVGIRIINGQRTRGKRPKYALVDQKSYLGSNRIIDITFDSNAKAISI